MAMKVEARSLMGFERKISYLSDGVVVVADDGGVTVREGGDSERGRLRDMVSPI